MRGTVAKRLRREARRYAMKETSRETRYVAAPMHNTLVQRGLLPDGSPKTELFFYTGTMRLGACARGIQKYFKLQHKRSQIHV